MNQNNEKQTDGSGRKNPPSSIRAERPGPMLYPLPAVMVSCGDMENSNIITIAWTGIINSDPPMTYISVRKSRHSHEIIRESGEFVINLVTADLAHACDYCGVKSGASIDKFRETGLTKTAGELVAAPMIGESPVHLECHVFDIRELPSHDMFLAEIVAVHLQEDLIDEQGAYRLDRLDLVSYNHGHYYKVEKSPIGRFGFSVMKPKTIRRKRKEAARKNKLHR